MEVQRSAIIAGAIAVRGDSLRHLIGWQGRGVTNLPPGRCILRLHLTDATVYALSRVISGKRQMNSDRHECKDLDCTDSHGLNATRSVLIRVYLT